ncbi:MAG: ATP-grasp domain-containing protein [Desulfobacula sp.]|nr:ATP-grasp domain-containing protein [Desulfobacula sp.]
MGNLKVMVTGVGGIIGHGILQSLKKLQHNITIVGMDLKSDAYGRHWCDCFYAKPSKKEDESYLLFLDQIIAKEAIDLILPGIEQDVYFFNGHREFFKERNVVIALNKKELIIASKDKWNIYRQLENKGIEAIATKIEGSWQECKQALGDPPFLIKPRRGSGSQGIVIIDDKEDFLYWKKKNGLNFMIQKIVGTEEEEYTVGAFGLGYGESLSPIIFRRKLSGTGSTQFAEVVFDDNINLMVKKLNKIFLPVGPTNYQFRMEGNNIYLLEINPRISSSTSMRTAFGYNEAEMCINYFLNRKTPINPHIVKGKVFRYSKDYVLL